MLRQCVHAGIVVLAVSALSGCGKSSENGDTRGHAGGAPGGSNEPSRCDADCPGCDTADAAHLFGWPTVPAFELTLPEERWQHLQDHAIDEEYEPACLTFEGDPVGEVGLRFKGSYGTLYPCLSGEQSCPKLSMKVKFSEVDKEQRFHGLKRLNFHSMLHDPTRLRERLGYDLYREMGVESPRSAWATLRINGESYGLFSMVEQVDGRFTADRWPEDGDGNLFKEAWPQTDDASYYTERQKTNEDEADAGKFVAFFADLDAVSSPEDRAEALGRWTSIEHFQRYMAVDDAIFNCDGVTAFYSEEEWEGNHNYYVYQEAERDHFSLIPWDLDSTFTPWATWSAIPRWTDIPEDCETTYPTWDGSDLQAVAPGCDPVFQGLAANIDPYRDAVEELLAGPFAEEHILDKMSALSAHIANAIAEDPLGPTVEGWEAEVNQLRSMIPILRDRLTRLADGERVVAFTLDPTAVNGFEAAGDLELLLGTQLFHNPSTTVDLSIHADSPLSGERDLRIDFEYRDEADDDYAQWMAHSLAFVGAPIDFGDATGIRLLASADTARTLRIDLGSPANTNGYEGIRPGWEVEVGPEPTTVEVHFADAVVQSWAEAQGLDPHDPLEDILASVTTLHLHPYCKGRDGLGFLGDGVTDPGYLQVDNIEFFTEE